MAQPRESFQHTLRSSVACCGVGLHSGKVISLRIHPAPANSGIRFFRLDLPGCVALQAHMDRVIDTRLATTLGNELFRVSTVEHLLAALNAYGVDNAKIEMDGEEVPIMDGSAAPFFLLLESAGLCPQAQPRLALRITRPIHFHDGDKRLAVFPYHGLKVSGEICFDDAVICKQKYTYEANPGNFLTDLAKARTFGYVEQVEELWANGLALGGSLANVIAIHWNRQSVLNEDGLRYADEFIRHKVVDLLGDLSLLGHRLYAHVTSYKAGHTQHLGLLRAIAASPHCWELVKMSPSVTLHTRHGDMSDASLSVRTFPPLFDGPSPHQEVTLR
jgi:UDP-3-O-[3-hydroxymyristoyl] N-acetylglucosamine deacetylase